MILLLSQSDSWTTGSGGRREEERGREWRAKVEGRRRGEKEFITARMESHKGGREGEATNRQWSHLRLPGS